MTDVHKGIHYDDFDAVLGPDSTQEEVYQEVHGNACLDGELTRAPPGWCVLRERRARGLQRGNLCIRTGESYSSTLHLGIA